MARALGIEITDADVRLCAVERSGKRTRILQAIANEIPAGEAPWEERATAALKTLLAASKVPRVRPVAAVDSGHAILREVALPFKGEEQVRKTVRFEMESLIHNYAIEQLVVSHYKSDETDKGSMLLAAAVPKDRLARLLRIHQEAGVDPVAVDLDVAGVFNALWEAGGIDPAAPHLLVYGTSKFTKLVWVEQGRPRSIRTLRFALGGGGEAAAPLEMRETDMGVEPLVVVTDTGGSLAGATGPATLASILAKEISRFLLAGAAGAQPAHLLLAGDFDGDEAAASLEAATGIPAKRVDALKALDPSSVPGRSGRFAAALGLALKGAGADALGFDFRQDEFQYARKFEALRTTALVTLELAVVLLAAVALHFFLQGRELRSAVGEVLKHHKVLVEDATGETLSDAMSAYPRLVELHRQALASLGSGETPLVESARTAWIELFNAIRRFQQKYATQKLGGGELFLEVENLDVQQTTTSGNEALSMTLRGKIRNHEFAGVFRNEVRASALFANADWFGPMQPLEGGLVQFTLKATKPKRERRT